MERMESQCLKQCKRNARPRLLGWSLILAVLSGGPVGAQSQSSALDSALQVPAQLPADYNERLKDFKPKQLPPEQATDHNLNKVLDLGPLRQSALITVDGTRPIRLEASYNEPLSLADVLDATISHSLPIRISQESLNFQRLQFGAQVVDVLPNFSTGFSVGQAKINTVTTAYNRIFSTSLRYPVFQGGAVVYSILSQYYRQKGWTSSYRATINDALLDVYQKYTNLVLNNAIMQIRARAVAISESQLALNNAVYKSGNGTQFAIMQSRTQLAADRQALLAQQVLVRQSAMALAFALDMPMSINIVPDQDLVIEDNLFGGNLSIKDLLDRTMECRPELRQYECFRLAAARNVQVSASGLYPNVSLFTTYTHSVASVFPPGNTGALNGLANATINASLFGTGLASNTALNQTASFSPTGNNLGNSGANTTATVVAGSGGNPIATTQSGSLVTSGAVAPSFASGSNAFAAGGSNINGSNTAGAGVFPGLFNTFQSGLSLAWSLPNVGAGTVASIAASRALARQAMVQANQELLLVVEQVRGAYLNTIATREQIDTAAKGVASTGEALRLASLRLSTGLGSNLELIQAQRDYIAALITQAQAIIASNQAQVQLLHDTGLISRETILHGYQPATFTQKKPKKKWWQKI
ncbi:MAG: TolC family protein [Cyanobacteria bacterium SZAS LIN-3]|nr:TolC family protein [Cyanobacteria bacterium SZAS LIN-3]